MSGYLNMLDWFLHSANVDVVALLIAIIAFVAWHYYMYFSMKGTETRITALQKQLDEDDEALSMMVQEFTTYKTNHENLDNKVAYIQGSIKESLDKISAKLDLLSEKVWTLSAKK